MESRPGTYALILWSAVEQDVQVGRLGSLHVQRGFYVYVGSAFGPGGVLARVGHHQRETQRPHWHIDYLRKTAQLRAVWYSHDPVRREHEWAAIFGKIRGAIVPLRNFGTSDCTCASHLYHFTSLPSLRVFWRKLQTCCPHQERVRQMMA